MKMWSTIYPDKPRAKFVTRDNVKDGHVAITVSMGNGEVVHGEIVARLFDGGVNWQAHRSGDRGSDVLAEWRTDAAGYIVTA